MHKIFLFIAAAACASQAMARQNPGPIGSHTYVGISGGLSSFNVSPKVLATTPIKLRPFETIDAVTHSYFIEGIKSEGPGRYGVAAGLTFGGDFRLQDTPFLLGAFAHVGYSGATAKAGYPQEDEITDTYDLTAGTYDKSINPMGSAMVHFKGGLTTDVGFRLGALTFSEEFMPFVGVSWVYTRVKAKMIRYGHGSNFVDLNTAPLATANYQQMTKASVNGNVHAVAVTVGASYKFTSNLSAELSARWAFAKRKAFSFAGKFEMAPGQLDSALKLGAKFQFQRWLMTFKYTLPAFR